MNFAVNPQTNPELDKSPFPCIICGREFSNVVSTEQCPNQPYEACTFNARGHYGCTVFDEFDGAQLEINVCDECLKAARTKGHVGYWPGHPKRKLTAWDGE
jgi:hypothetical protein